VYTNQYRKEEWFKRYQKAWGDKEYMKGLRRKKQSELTEQEKDLLRYYVLDKMDRETDEIVKRKRAEKREARKRATDKTYTSARLDGGCLVLSPNRWALKEMTRTISNANLGEV
jgi:hypothetical protein